MFDVLGRLSDFMERLAANGGPSVTRWVFVRTAEVISLGWLGLVGAIMWVYIRNHTTDTGLLTLTGTLGAGLFGFAQNAQTTKLAIDAKSTGNPSTVTTNPLGSTVTSGDQQKGINTVMHVGD